ncbi:palmitoyltransferase ZDHHC5-B [Lampris incognitus]|uniref:palmitoyltransferase ZDHHC5-B n=1 Tax=Lampris incognitus TaxID=2546036 RepID=UPI0024B591AE|nr:palmitoyltransferase ZDHHC5-B [Lampris incognitus]
MPGFSSGGVGGGVGGPASTPPHPFRPSRYVPVSAATTFLVGSTTLFFCFTCPWLSEYFSSVIPIYNAVVFLFTLANFCMATFMDPGVFPRAEEDEDKEDDFRAPLYKTVEIKGIQVRMKWCSTCRFYRPPRCSHCSVCDNCVEDFDHHCPWVNNCIGRRNYRYFFLFLLSLTTHIINVFGFGLVYVLHHRQQLDTPHAAVTMAVMCVAGLFFVPVAGLTGFHIVLVARGRTTNEQVTGKFRGGVNPFTNGCLRNISHVLCSSQAPRYLGRWRGPQTVEVQPPFLRPPLTEAQLEAKVLDNGIQNDRHSTRSKSSLDQMESQSADAEPPPPPKPELRYPGLPRTDTEESSLLTDAPPTPSMYKYRPAYSSPGRNHSALTHPNKMIRGESLDSPSPSILQSSHQLSYRSEPSSLDGATVVGGGVGARRGGGERGEGPGGPGGPAGVVSGGMSGYSLAGRSYTSYPSSLVLSTGGSRSSSLRSAHTAHNVLATLQSEGTTDTSYKSLANQTPRNGSLSYDSLLTPSESPEFESAAHELSPQKPRAPFPQASGVNVANQPEASSVGAPLQGYTSPFLSAQIAQQREGQLFQGSASFSSPHRAYLRAVSPLPPSSGPPENLQLLHHNQDSSRRPPRASSQAPPSSSSSPRARSLEPPVSPPPRGPSLGKSQSYTGEAGPQHKLRPTGGGTVSGGGGARGGPQAPQSTSRPGLANHSTSKPGGGVKKVTGVGGTTYEISV